MHEFDLSWRVNSACQGLDPDIFSPESEDNCDQAIAICESCHVRIACLNYALETRENVTAAVHYIRFEFSPEQIEEFAKGEVQVISVLSNYIESTELAQYTVSELLIDLRD